MDMGGGAAFWGADIGVFLRGGMFWGRLRQFWGGFRSQFWGCSFGAIYGAVWSSLGAL